RHTRCYRDWSSDVCSSDLGPVAGCSMLPASASNHVRPRLDICFSCFIALLPTTQLLRNCSTVEWDRCWQVVPDNALPEHYGARRSEERRVGKECRSGGCRW